MDADKIALMVNAVLPPVLFVCAGKYQPNSNRTNYAYGFAVISVLCMAVCAYMPDDYYWSTYLIAALMYCVFADWLCQSDNDSEWCMKLITSSIAGMWINFTGCALWLLYLDPLPYNISIGLLNIYMLWAMMLDGNIHRRFDGLGVARRARSIDFQPRIVQLIKQVATK